jgi:rhodanese-related sulfurtransferase
MARAPFLSGLIMATLLCWSHIFLLPPIFVGRGLPVSALIGGALKGVFFSPLLIFLGLCAGFMSLFLGAVVSESLSLLLVGRPFPIWLNSILATWFCACVALGGAIAGACAGLVARDELVVPAPAFWRLALGGGMASIVMVPLALPVSVTESFVLLLVSALPSLVLFRPKPTAPISTAHRAMGEITCRVMANRNGVPVVTNFFSRLFRQSSVTSPGWLEIDDLWQRLDAGEPVLLIDVRGPDEFGSPPGHLPGAINIPLPELAGRVAEVSAQFRPVVLVCKTDRRSAKAAETLIAAGLADVAVLRGGTDGWHQRGLPLD